MKKMMIFGIILELTGSLMAGDDIKPDQIIEYKQTAETNLTLHVFFPPGHSGSDKDPAIVFFFGGGWVAGSPKQFYPQSKYLASRGMVSICADYRVSSRHHTPPMVCVKDGKSAIRWVRRHAEKLGIDPNRLAAGGGSAGGQVAAAVALDKGFNEEGEDLTISCRPDALVLFNPVIDNGPDGFGYDWVQKYWHEFSPIDNIRNNPPPTLFQVGTIDKHIPVETAERYNDEMTSVGGRCDLILYKDQPHGFFNGAKYTETLMEMDKFLVSLGYLKGDSVLKP